MILWHFTDGGRWIKVKYIFAIKLTSRRYRVKQEVMLIFMMRNINISWWINDEIGDYEASNYTKRHHKVLKVLMLTSIKAEILQQFFLFFPFILKALQLLWATLTFIEKHLLFLLIWGNELSLFISYFIYIYNLLFTNIYSGRRSDWNHKRAMKQWGAWEKKNNDS